jgi:hypothetical protein
MQENPMKVKVATLMLGITTAALLFASSAEAGCITRRGKGWAWTEDTARFQAWEIVSQKYGNWPLPETNFKNERYKCKPDGSGYTCLSWIDVCK